MDQIWIFTDHLLDPPYLRMVFSFLGAFLIVWFSIPSIIRTSRQKGLLYIPNERSSHAGAVPDLGGIALFAGIVIPTLVFLYSGNLRGIQFVIAGIIIIFMVGIKDDVSGLTPWAKLIGQIIACLVLILPGNLILTNLHGFLTIGPIQPEFGTILTLFVMIVIINSINLIDGIDGLAGGLSLVVFLTYGIWFYLAGQYVLAIISAACIGSLIAFLYFNVFGKEHQIFMGDAGSLVLGFIIAFFSILFNQLNIDPNIPNHVTSAPSVSMAILVIPLYDTIRIFVLRLLKGQSPFTPDHSHVHHILIGLSLSHRMAALVLILFNIGCIILAFCLSKLGVSVIKMVLILLLLCFAGAESLHQLERRKRRRTARVKCEM